MSLDPLLNATPAIQIHAIAALISFFLGPFILFSKKGDTKHKVMGRVWGISMAVTIASSFLIFEIQLFGPFSPIHLLSVFSAGSLVLGINFARKGNISAHRKTMSGLYFGALIVAGIFTFFPDRIMNQVFFNGRETIGFIGVVTGTLLSGLALAHAKRQGWIKQ
ncbi:MAG: DUF2306 domain-containing protein [Rhizobiaceae bacterium]|nr:DUF2306 domain-containing protein [Rhizobiaceae bacterium]